MAAGFMQAQEPDNILPTFADSEVYREQILVRGHAFKVGIQIGAGIL